MGYKLLINGVCWGYTCGVFEVDLLLMVQKSGHQLRLVVYPIIYDRFKHYPRWLFGISSSNCMFGRAILRFTRLLTSMILFMYRYVSCDVFVPTDVFKYHLHPYTARLHRKFCQSEMIQIHIQNRKKTNHLMIFNVPSESSPNVEVPNRSLDVQI